MTDEFAAAKKVVETVRKAGKFFELEKEMGKIKQELLLARQNNQELAETHIRQRRHSLDMHRALSFYAADSNYPENIHNDSGKLARSVLARVVMNQ